MLGAVLFAPGCADDTDIVGSIELGELIRLDLPPDETVGSIGMIDGWVLVLTQRRVVSPPPEWAPSAIDLYVRWLSPDNVLSAPIYAGRALGTYRSPRWVRDGDALTGPLWGVWNPSGPPEDARTYIRMPRYQPGESVAACELTPELPVAVDPDQAALVMWSSFPAYSGVEGLEPAASSPSGARAYAHFLPDSCAPPHAVTGSSLLAVSGSGCASLVSPSSWAADPCRSDPEDYGMATLWTLELPAGGVGLLYRAANRMTATRWLVLENGVRPIARPVTVGRLAHDTTGVGHQPRGAMSGERVVFSERDEHEEYCALLRTMSLDGTDARDAPWQLPCWRQRVEHYFVNQPVRLHPFLELLPVADLAVLAYVDTPNPILEEPAPGPTRLWAVGLTSFGRRATEAVDVAAPESDPLGYLRTASDGSDFAALFLDAAVGREAFWIRRVRLASTAR